jgi:predicted dehydrogenase
MSKIYRLGIIGFGHMHINNVASLFADHPQVEWAACADTVPAVPELRAAPYTRDWNRAHLIEKLGIPRSYDDYHDMLAQEGLDIVIVTSENAQHPDVVEACAAAGTNVCVEKPMAMSLAHGLRMARACRAAGTMLVVNWPLTWSPAARKAKELIDEGVIGRVLELKWRAGHTGPLGSGARHAGVSDVAAPMNGTELAATWWHQEAQGGGALLDFCCYGAMVSRWYIGEQAVGAMGMKANLNSQWGNANDNGIILVRFPGAMALLEGTWTTWDHGVPTGPIVYGTSGTLVVDSRDGQPIVRLERGHGETEIFEAEPLPKGRMTIAEEYVHHLDTGEPLHPTLELDFNLEVMAVLDAGVRSAVSGQLETVDSATWCVG